MVDPTAQDWSVCDQGALSREPDWIHGALEILSALSVDGEWVLGLSEEKQVQVAEIVSLRDEDGGLSESMLDTLKELCEPGARGAVLGAFDTGAFDIGSSESEAETDEEEDDLDTFSFWKSSGPPV